jgi:iron(III) transport system substrate-binding protein
VALLLLGAVACAAPAAPAPASAPAGAAPAQADTWDQIVAAANREGQVVLSGPASADTREGLTEGFQRKYPGIKVHYTGSPGSAVPPKLLAEREAGQYLTDVLVAGTTTQLDLIEAGVMEPLAGYLVGPDSRDPAPWLENRFDYADNAGTFNLVYTSSVKLPMVYNAEQVSPGEIRSYTDLLAPKWQGRLITFDPRSAGTGLAFATFFYTTDGLGPAYLQRLLAHGLVFTRDDRQLVDRVVRGQSAIGIAPSERIVTELSAKGVPIQMIRAQDLREGSYVTSGPGTFGVVNRAPHPNAAKVYVNYLLSREGQTEWSRATGFPSRRTDVPTDHLPDYTIPQPGAKYQLSWKESYVQLKDEVLDAIRAVPGS